MKSKEGELKKLRREGMKDFPDGNYKLWQNPLTSILSLSKGERKLKITSFLAQVYQGKKNKYGISIC
ncbi:MAG: hypothetical protein ACUVRZ_12345 [Desulfobacca sp.]|uniref:hypothetical protein n=1 Tax=Desulfobacca sp. TaxID=2067990 RepID=UPI00404B9520